MDGNKTIEIDIPKNFSKPHESQTTQYLPGPKLLQGTSVVSTRNVELSYKLKNESSEDRQADADDEADFREEEMKEGIINQNQTFTQLEAKEQNIIVEDTRPEWIKFLLDILEWRQDKVDLLTGLNEPTTVEDYLNAYALDEFLMRQHPFTASADTDNNSALTCCKICGDSAELHYEYRLCTICCNQQKSTQFFSMTQCNHTYCHSCWHTNIMTKLNRGELMRIKCLDYCCDQQCPEMIIQQILNEAEFARYKKFSNAFKVDTNKNLIFCPNTICQELINKSIQPVVCQKCQTKVCSKCDLKAHQGRCVNQNNSQFKFWALGTNLGVKNCPKCNSRTEKITGCNHMTCTRCTAEWCWICGQLIGHDHY